MNEKIFLWPGQAPYSEYSPEQAQPSLVAYEAKNAFGAIVVLAGGGYAFKSPHEAFPVAEMIRDAGVSAFVLDYRVHPCHMMAPLADASRSIRLLRKLGYKRVGILGFSAGGHLCCQAATHYDAGDPDSPDETERFASRPDAFFPCYAVSSFISYSHPWTVKNLLGEDYCNIDLLKYFSTELNVSGDTPPAFIWHTVTDATVPAEASLILAKALSDHKVNYELHLFPCGSHGLGLAPDDPVVSKWSGMLAEYLKREGWTV